MILNVWSAFSKSLSVIRRVRYQRRQEIRGCIGCIGCAACPGNVVDDGDAVGTSKDPCNRCDLCDAIFQQVRCKSLNGRNHRPTVCPGNRITEPHLD